MCSVSNSIYEINRVIVISISIIAIEIVFIPVDYCRIN